MFNSAQERHPIVLGTLWFLASLVLDSVNDLMMKMMGINLSAQQIIWMRFAASTLWLLPLIVFSSRQNNIARITSLPLHMFRSFLLYVGMTLWCRGLQNVHLAIATAINFTIPIFILIFARFLLREKLTMPQIMATCIGFLGILVIVGASGYAKGGLSFGGGELVFGAMLFALLDTVNKHFVAKESTLAMLFYSGFFVSLYSAWPAWQSWQEPTSSAVALCVILGLTGNGILFCLLKAFSYVNISAVAPYRYLELVMATALGYRFFGEIPTLRQTGGMALIVLSSVVLAYGHRLIKAKAA
jgi:S-adenosylmethionine uptake transporter